MRLQLCFFEVSKPAGNGDKAEELPPDYAWLFWCGLHVLWSSHCLALDFQLHLFLEILSQQQFFGECRGPKCSWRLQGIGSQNVLSNLHLLVVLLHSKDFHHLFLYSKGIDVLGESEFCTGKLAKAYETAAVFFWSFKASWKRRQGWRTTSWGTATPNALSIFGPTRQWYMLQFCMLTFTGGFSSCISYHFLSIAPWERISFCWCRHCDLGCKNELLCIEI